MSRPELYCRWHEVSGSRGAVVIVHGFGEHSGRYEHVIDALCARDYSCLAVDYRGWGRAGGRRAHVGRFDEYLDDVEWAVATCRQRSGGAPVLVGHSQGGLICALLAIERAPQLRGLALSSPAFQFAVEVPAWKRVAAGLASVLWPTFALPVGLSRGDLTRDPQVLDEMRADPLLVSSATARWYTESLRAQRHALQGAQQLTLPMLIMVAGDDRIVDHTATRSFFTACAAKDKTWHEYDGALHEVLNERPDIRGPALRDLMEWLDGLA